MRRKPKASQPFGGPALQSPPPRARRSHQSRGRIPALQKSSSLLSSPSRRSLSLESFRVGMLNSMERTAKLKEFESEVFPSQSEMAVSDQGVPKP